MRETDLAAPVAAFLAGQGYEVKSEVGSCDLVAMRGGEPPVLVELKSRFSLDLLLQGVAMGFFHAAGLARYVRASMIETLSLEHVRTARAKGQIAYDELVVDTDVAKVSVVGIGMRSHAGVAAAMFRALSAENVNIKVISTSEIKISVLIDRKYMELAVQALHDTFELEKA